MTQIFLDLCSLLLRTYIVIVAKIKIIVWIAELVDVVVASRVRSKTIEIQALDHLQIIRVQKLDQIVVTQNAV
jgi:hypothetical protein